MALSFLSRCGLWSPTLSGPASAPLGRVSEQVLPGWEQCGRDLLVSSAVTCPVPADPRAHRNLWRAARLQLLPPRSWRLDAPCSLPAEATLCWQPLDGGPCLSLVPPLPRENVTVNVSEVAGGSWGWGRKGSPGAHFHDLMHYPLSTEGS